MKKKYTQPVITRVKLDPAQAVLAVCKSAGAYFNTTTANSLCIDRTGAGNVYCVVYNKGYHNVNSSHTGNQYAPPS